MADKAKETGEPQAFADLALASLNILRHEAHKFMSEDDSKKFDAVYDTVVGNLEAKRNAG